MARLVPSEFDWNWYHQMENSNDDQPPAYATNNSHVNPNSTAIEEKKGKYTRNRPPALHLRSIETADQRVPTLPQNYEAPTLPGRRLYSSTATFLKKSIQYILIHRPLCTILHPGLVVIHRHMIGHMRRLLHPDSKSLMVDLVNILPIRPPTLNKLQF